MLRNFSIAVGQRTERRLFAKSRPVVMGLRGDDS